jgi:N-acetylneuraminate lyase
MLSWMLLRAQRVFALTPQTTLMPSYLKLTGLVAATHTPMNPDGSLNLKPVEAQAEHLLRNQIRAAFICGSTGEGHSLSVDERRRMAQCWSGVVRGTPLKLIVHVGHNALPEAQALAADAERLGAHAIAALAPSYFKPATVTDLVEFCAAVAGAAPSLPFFFYDIPAFTGVHLSMTEFLTLARDRIPTLAGLKYSNPDDISLQQILRHSGGTLDILYGIDECLLGALTFGVCAAVGSTYNFAAPIYHRLIAAFEQGDLDTARAEQFKSIELVRICSSFGYLRASKAVMGMVGIECGPIRLPLRPLFPSQITELQTALAKAGFFDWIQA